MTFVYVFLQSFLFRDESAYAKPFSRCYRTPGVSEEVVETRLLMTLTEDTGV